MLRCRLFERDNITVCLQDTQRERAGRPRAAGRIEEGLTGLSSTSKRKSLSLTPSSALWNQTNVLIRNPCMFLRHNNSLSCEAMRFNEFWRRLQLTQTHADSSDSAERMLVAHFIFPPCHLCRPTENATPGLMCSKADGAAAQCWNTAFHTETSGSEDNDLSQNTSKKDWKGERGWRESCTWRVMIAGRWEVVSMPQ